MAREPMFELAYVCKACDGTGRSNKSQYSEDCDWCGGTGLRRRCTQGDCYEYGCSGYGDCNVSDDEARLAGFPLIESGYVTGEIRIRRIAREFSDRRPDTRPWVVMLAIAILALALIAAGAWMALG